MKNSRVECVSSSGLLSLILFLVAFLGKHLAGEFPLGQLELEKLFLGEDF